MNVIEIVIKYLKKNKYDGLCHLDCGCECGCSIEDLQPCGEACDFAGCEPAYKVMKGGPGCTKKRCDFCDECSPSDWCMVLKKSK